MSDSLTALFMLALLLLEICIGSFFCWSSCLLLTEHQTMRQVMTLVTMINNTTVTAASSDTTIQWTGSPTASNGGSVVINIQSQSLYLYYAIKK